MKFTSVAVYPDGTRFKMTRRNGKWWWAPNAASSHYANAVANVESRGGRVEKVPVASDQPVSFMGGLFATAFDDGR